MRLHASCSVYQLQMSWEAFYTVVTHIFQRCVGKYTFFNREFYINFLWKSTNIPGPSNFGSPAMTLVGYSFLNIEGRGRAWSDPTVGVWPAENH